MDSQKIGNWIQIVSGIALIVGIGLVIWELQQVRILTRAQLTSDNVSASVASNSAVMGENAAEILAKACLDPGTLSLHETTLLGYFYDQQIALVVRMKLLTDRDGLYAKDTWKNSAGPYFADIFRTAFGRAWFLRQGAWVDEEVLQAGYDFLEANAEPWCEVEHRELIKGAELYRQLSVEPSPILGDAMQERIRQHFLSQPEPGETLR